MKKYYLPLCLLISFHLLQPAFAAGQDLDYVPFTKCWELSGENLNITPTASDNANENMYLINSDRIISADLHGQVLWINDPGGRVRSSVVENDGRLFVIITKMVADHEDSSLRILSLQTGLTVAEVELPDFPMAGGARIFPLNSELMVLQIEEELFWINPRLERFLTRNSISKKRDSDVSQDGEEIVYVNPTGDLDRFSLISKQRESVLKTGLPRSVRVLVHKTGYLVFGDSGEITFFDKGTKVRVWSGRLGGDEISVNFLDDRVFVSSTDNFIYSIILRNGKINWSKRFDSRISGILHLLSGQLVVSSINDQKTYLMDFENGKTTNIILADPPGEYYIGQPFVFGDRILLFQNGRVNGYRFGGCSD